VLSFSQLIINSTAQSWSMSATNLNPNFFDLEVDIASGTLLYLLQVNWLAYSPNNAYYVSGLLSVGAGSVL
jgi:hypothetical protein